MDKKQHMVNVSPGKRASKMWGKLWADFLNIRFVLLDSLSVLLPMLGKIQCMKENILSVFSIWQLVSDITVLLQLLVSLLNSQHLAYLYILFYWKKSSGRPHSTHTKKARLHLSCGLKEQDSLTKNHSSSNTHTTTKLSGSEYRAYR